MGMVGVEDRGRERVCGRRCGCGRSFGLGCCVQRFEFSVYFGFSMIRHTWLEE